MAHQQVLTFEPDHRNFCSWSSGRDWQCLYSSLWIRTKGTEVMFLEEPSGGWVRWNPSFPTGPLGERAFFVLILPKLPFFYPVPPARSWPASVPPLAPFSHLLSLAPPSLLLCQPQPLSLSLSALELLLCVTPSACDIPRLTCSVSVMLRGTCSASSLISVFPCGLWLCAPR